MPRDLSYRMATALAERHGYHPLQILLDNMTELQRAAEQARTPERQFELLTRAGRAAARVLPYCMPRAGVVDVEDL